MPTTTQIAKQLLLLKRKAGRGTSSTETERKALRCAWQRDQRLRRGGGVGVDEIPIAFRFSISSACCCCHASKCGVAKALPIRCRCIACKPDCKQCTSSNSSPIIRLCCMTVCLRKSSSARVGMCPPSFIVSVET